MVFIVNALMLLMLLMSLMLLHYQIWICISGHSKFNMDWNLTFYTGIQNSKFHDPLTIQLPIKIKLSDPPANTFLKFLTPLPPPAEGGACHEN